MRSNIKTKNITLTIAVIMFIGVSIIVFLSFPFQGPRDIVGDYEVDKIYQLAFTQQYQDQDGRIGQTFMTKNTCGFSIPLREPRGARNVFTAAELSEEMPESSFKLIRKISPAVTVGAATFQTSYRYVVVVYNANLGKQDFVPVFEPNNQCSE